MNQSNPQSNPQQIPQSNPQQIPQSNPQQIPQQTPISVKIVKEHLFKRIISHPFRYYWRAGGFTFCFVTLTNTYTSLINQKMRADMFEYPQLFSIALLGKSTYFGLLWPSCYMTLMNPKRYREILYLGEGVDKYCSEIDKMNNEK